MIHMICLHPRITCFPVSLLFTHVHPVSKSLIDGSMKGQYVTLHFQERMLLYQISRHFICVLIYHCFFLFIEKEEINFYHKRYNFPII